MARRRIEGWVTPMWLSHHYPEDYDRCVRVGHRHLCRRCVVLYPLAVLVLGIGAALAVDPAVTAAALVILPLPAVVEWTLEHLGVVAYAPARQVAVTIPLAVGLGAGFVRYFEQRTDPWFWTVVLGYGGWCAAVALWSWRHPR